MYNGYSNYETWLAALHIDNDESLQDQFTGLANRLETYELSQEIKSYFEEEIPEVKSMFFSDLINAALKEINWYEIAENLKEFAEE